MSTTFAASTHGIVKDFESGDATARVLHGIDLDLRAGELTMLVGPSGCGKTTLLSIITGILTPTAGTVSVYGVDIGSLRGQDKVVFRRAHLGFIFQQYNLLPALTAAENAALPLVAAGVALWAGMPVGFLFLLVCPLMMFFMMKGMAGMGSQAPAPPPASPVTPPVEEVEHR